MLTWQIDRFLRSGPLCAVATFVVPAVLAVIVNSVSSVENVLGVMLVASLIICIGSLAGSVVASGLGTMLFGLGTLLAEVSPALMLVVALVLFANLMLHDLAGVFRRAPSINRSIWRTTAIVTGAIWVGAALGFGVAYLVATLATWQSIVVPFGVAAIGFGAKLAADAHQSEARQLTAKRRDTQTAESPDGSAVGNDSSN